MHWLLLILGIPCGIIMGLIGNKLSRKVRRPLFKYLVNAVPISLFCGLVIIIDILL